MIHTAPDPNSRSLRLLCLHGGDMTADGFRCMLKHIEAQYAGQLELTMAQAPHPGRSGYLWMGKDQAASEATWPVSLAYLRELIREQGPFDGLLGYSMGACAAVSLQ